MAGGTIRFHREMIHRESSRASVLNHSGDRAVLHSSATAKCCLTTPSLLSRATQRRFGIEARPPGTRLGLSPASRGQSLSSKETQLAQLVVPPPISV